MSFKLQALVFPASFDVRDAIISGKINTAILEGLIDYQTLTPVHCSLKRALPIVLCSPEGNWCMQANVA